MGTNTTGLNNITDPINVFNEINTQTHGNFSLGIVLSVFFIAFAALKSAGKSTDEILIFTGALEFLLISLLIAMGWLNISYIMLPVALLMAGILINRFSGGG